jgi:hypothetical protein
MAEDKLPTRKENFSEWYNQLVLKAELDYARPRVHGRKAYGWTLWENMSGAWIGDPKTRGTSMLHSQC